MVCHFLAQRVLEMVASHCLVKTSFAVVGVDLHGWAVEAAAWSRTVLVVVAMLVCPL
jgi:hypothetical protein